MFNRQRKLTVDLSELRAFLRRLSERLEIHAPFSVVLISDRAMRAYNRKYASKDYSTDVLSFPAGGDNLQSDACLGDILISVETADRQKETSTALELQLLCIHGLLHLLGYDHEADGGEMVEFELNLRKELGLS